MAWTGFPARCALVTIALAVGGCGGGEDDDARTLSDAHRALASELGERSATVKAIVDREEPPVSIPEADARTQELARAILTGDLAGAGTPADVRSVLVAQRAIGRATQASIADAETQEQALLDARLDDAGDVSADVRRLLAAHNEMAGESARLFGATAADFARAQRANRATERAILAVLRLKRGVGEAPVRPAIVRARREIRSARRDVRGDLDQALTRVRRNVGSRLEAVHELAGESSEVTAMLDVVRAESPDSLLASVPEE